MTCDILPLCMLLFFNLFSWSPSLISFDPWTFSNFFEHLHIPFQVFSSFSLDPWVLLEHSLTLSSWSLCPHAFSFGYSCFLWFLVSFCIDITFLELGPHEFKVRSCTIKWRQLPVTPAYIFTNYKSQAQTINHLIIDLGKTTSFSLNPFNAYIALSRSYGRHTIRLLWDFDNALFIHHPSDDLRCEDNRLEKIIAIHVHLLTFSLMCFHLADTRGHACCTPPQDAEQCGKLTILSAHAWTWVVQWINTERQQATSLLSTHATCSWALLLT